MPHRALPRLVALIFLAWVVPARAEDFAGKVMGVSDGDTITVLRGRTPVKIRLHGIDAPETGQDFGTRAKQAASDLAFGKVVTVQPRGTDRYGRTVALVVLPDGRILNHELVRSGYAWWYKKYAPGDTTLEQLEAEARGARRGLGHRRPRSRPGTGGSTRGCPPGWPPRSSGTGGASCTTGRPARARRG